MNMTMRNYQDEWTPERRAAWEKTRSRGKNHFVWVRGFFVWGGLMILATTLAQLVIRVAFSSIIPFKSDVMLQVFFLNCFLCPAGGYIWGILVWLLTENSYRKHLDKTGS